MAGEKGNIVVEVLKIFFVVLVNVEVENVVVVRPFVGFLHGCYV